MAREYLLTYYPWITQHVESETIRQAVNDFATAIEGIAKCKVTVLKPISVPAQIKWIGKTAGGIALMNPLGLALARQAAVAVEAINVALRPEILVDANGHARRTTKLVPTYRAQIYTSTKSGIRVRDDKTLLAQIRRPVGATLGFGVSYSTSNFLFPAWELETKLSVNPLTSFTSVQYLGGHDLVAKAVYSGAIDLGAGHDGVIVDLAEQSGFGDAEERLVPLRWTDFIPSDPIAANVSDATERADLASAIVAASATSQGSDALKTFWGGVTTLAVQTSSAYDPVATCMRDLHLTGTDLLGP